jgi:AmiR/NasT family two-component response regulator
VAAEGELTGLRVLAADEDERALRETTELLRELGHEVTDIAVDVATAVERIAGDEPDLAVVVVHEDDEHALALIEELNEYASGPVIALLHGEDPAFVARAAERGISAYTRQPTAASVQGAIDVAMARHAELRELHDQVERLEGAIERRAVIERAKGIVMERHGVGEREAFELLRAHARAHNRRVVAVAASVIEGGTFLPPGRD